jgi:hypothetical protein
MYALIKANLAFDVTIDIATQQVPSPFCIGAVGFGQICLRNNPSRIHHPILL